MIIKKNLIRILEKLPDDVEIELCVLSDEGIDEIYATLERVNFEDLDQHNIIYLEGKENI